MTQDQKDAFARALGITPDEQRVLDAGNEHSFDCRCEDCRLWWRSMGPDGTTYGPFKPEEIEDDTEEGKQCRAMRLENEKEENQQ